MAACAAIRSRSSKWATASSVSEVGSSTWIVPGLDDISAGKPLSRKTSIIRWFSGMTSAVNSRDPIVLRDLGQMGE